MQTVSSNNIRIVHHNPPDLNLNHVYAGMKPESTNVALGPDFSNEYHIGDWIDPTYVPPYSPVEPYNPHWWETTQTLGFIATVPTAWRTNVADPSKFVLSIDLPGVRPEDLSVETNCGNVIVKGKRFDSGVPVEHTYNVGMMKVYDLASAEATFEASVLTIVIMKAQSFDNRRIAVKSK